jgi:HTH-type transcriptional regulator, competence development regulator
MTLGEILRQLRRDQGVGIKRLAPELKVDYSYISRLENDKVVPSKEVIDRIANYFNYDRDELMVLSDRLPDDIKKILRENPKEALEYLRERFVRDRGK